MIIKISIIPGQGKHLHELPSLFLNAGIHIQSVPEKSIARNCFHEFSFPSLLLNKSLRRWSTPVKLGLLKVNKIVMKSIFLITMRHSISGLFMQCMEMKGSFPDNGIRTVPAGSYPSTALTEPDTSNRCSICYSR